MQLLLMRHGKAELRASSDFERQLTAVGREDVHLVAEALSQQVGDIEKLLVSPYVRTRQTAEIMQQCLGSPPPEVTEALAPGTTLQQVISAIEQAFSGLANGLVVMHQPIIGRLVLYLTDVGQSMDPGSIAVIDAPVINAGACRLKCVI